MSESAWVPEHDKRQSKASAKVIDVANTSKLGLKSHQAARDLAITAESEASKSRTSFFSSTSKSTTVKKTPTTDTRPAPTSTTVTDLTVTSGRVSQSTAAKRKLEQLASVLDDEDEDSHAVPKGPLPSHFFLIAYRFFFLSFSLKEISCRSI
jgi:hypothetical protein